MISYIEMLRHHKNAVDLVTAKKRVKQRVEELLRIDTILEIQQNMAEFKPCSDIRKSNLIGHILYYPCIRQCTVNKIPLRLIKGQTDDLVITMKDRRGEVVNTNKNVTVVLTSPDGSCKDVKMIEISDGTHTVTVHGEVVGDYKFSISVSGQGIPGSPFDFRVLIPLVKTFGGLGDEKGYFSHPRGLAFNNDGHLVLADWYNNRVQVVDQGGNVKKVFAFTQFVNKCAPLDVAISTEGLQFISDSLNQQILVCDKDGKLIRSFGEAELRHPRTTSS
ncbi:E3 ubiquitin-protein ligase TRIM71-like [Ptychodera flava]|uniref:E3 ubiquitin-protein ligase TRIM71-like n=1 Tax=Ptychodera flava TaxID=63121 RepID=UPI00396A6302